jgi:hypothetical protein
VSSTHQKEPKWHQSGLNYTLVPSKQVRPKGRHMLVEIIDAHDAKLPHIMIALADEVVLAVFASALSPPGLYAPADGFLAFVLQAKNR